MKLNLEWLKKHPAAAGAAILVGLLVLFLLFRRSSGGGSNIASLAAGQEQGQLQLAQLNAQQSAQQNQLQAQLSAQEFATQAQVQQSQDQLAATILDKALPYQFEAPLYEQQLKNQAAEQAALIPLESNALSISKRSNRGITGTEELALLLGESSAVPSLASADATIATGSGSGFTLGLPGGISLGAQLGTGLFG